MITVRIGENLHTIDDHWPVEGPSREGGALAFSVCPCSGDCAYMADHLGPITAQGSTPAQLSARELFADHRAQKEYFGYKRPAKKLCRAQLSPRSYGSALPLPTPPTFIQVIRHPVIREGKPGKPGHRNIGRGSFRSALADGVERRSTAVVRGRSPAPDGGPWAIPPGDSTPAPPPSASSVGV